MTGNWKLFVTAVQTKMNEELQVASDMMERPATTKNGLQFFLLLKHQLNLAKRRLL